MWGSVSHLLQMALNIFSCVLMGSRIVSFEVIFSCRLSAGNTIFLCKYRLALGPDRAAPVNRKQRRLWCNSWGLYI